MGQVSSIKRIKINPKLKVEPLICLCRDMHKIQNFESRIKIYFIFNKKDFYLSSVYLRTFQTVKLLSESTNAEIRVIDLDLLEKLELSDSIIILSKSALSAIGEYLIHKLSTKRNILIADLLDSKTKTDRNFINIFLVHDKEMLKSSNNFQLFRIIHHAPDWRLKSSLNCLKSNKIIYIGSKEKFLFERNSSSVLDCIFLKNYKFDWLTPKWITESNLYNFHLTAKPLGAAYDQPITKIVNALRVNSIPIIGSWERLAREILGQDYRFTIQAGTANEMIEQLVTFTESVEPGEISLNLKIKASVEYLVCPVYHINLWIDLLKEANDLYVK
jgi:hypothetical protein